METGSLTRDDVGMEAGSVARDFVGMEHSLALPPVTLSEATRSVAESKGPIRFGTTVPTAAHRKGADKLLCRSSRFARVSAGVEERERAASLPRGRRGGACLRAVVFHHTGADDTRQKGGGHALPGSCSRRRFSSCSGGMMKTPRCD